MKTASKKTVPKKISAKKIQAKQSSGADMLIKELKSFTADLKRIAQLISDKSVPQHERNMAALVMSLMFDTTYCAITLHTHENTATGRRNLIRSISAAIEGLIHALQGHILVTFPSLLTPSEYMLLKEQTPEAKSDGTAGERTMFVSLKNNIRFIFSTLIHCYGLDASIVDYSENGWRQVHAFIDIRNRITHPRVLSDLTITKEDMSIAVDAQTWVAKAWKNIIKAHNIKHVTNMSKLPLVKRKAKRVVAKKSSKRSITTRGNP